MLRNTYSVVIFEQQQQAWRYWASRRPNYWVHHVNSVRRNTVANSGSDRLSRLMQITNASLFIVLLSPTTRLAHLLAVFTPLAAIKTRGQRLIATRRRRRR